MFKVAVRDSPVGVRGGYQLVADGVRERLPPDVRGAGGAEEHAAHSEAGSISCPQQSRVLWDDLGEVSRPAAEVGGEAAERVQAVANEGVDADAVRPGFVEGKLEGAEQSRGAGDGDGHKAEAAEHALPFLVADTFDSAQLGEQGGEHSLLVSRQFDGVTQAVDDPAENELAG